MSDVHVKQFTGSACASRNCAAASGAMAVAFAGGPQFSADQFRTFSGISCTPGVDTVSGGLRSVDVWRVARSFDVDINYGGVNGAVTDWPATALEFRLRNGQGAIVLGDAKDAPTNPSTNVVYHSAWVHGFRVTSTGTKQTHWHDPRNTGASWQSIAGVIRYWQGMDHGLRFAGFVVPNQIQSPPDTSTGGSIDMINAKTAGRRLGQAWISGPGHQLIDPTNLSVMVPVADGDGPFDVLAELRLVGGSVNSDPDPEAAHVFLVDRPAMGYARFVLAADVRVEVDQPPPTDTATAYNQGLDAAGAAVARELRR